ncbi:Pet127-domain-containing protein [Dothidotthia symphoricarpi CBS 119687]|uniref:Pet127-domain-containing protein n=1 Tax=Dothidotthia symphoricarpi CBS 119687 TaxID=1392245 RepID=A0A6A6A9T3_9PLEO|nr:Pet127-domain-containing protein [Dothidotthia symphoricarpi CBS 119687]KAF2128326.1 Pet127-domain-containing protein [Dothidotthia symphoricarpi CBS 119687]
MLARKLVQASSWRSPPASLRCAARRHLPAPQHRRLNTTGPLLERSKAARRKGPDKTPPHKGKKGVSSTSSPDTQDAGDEEKDVVRRVAGRDHKEGAKTKDDRDGGPGISLKEALLGKTKKARASNLPIKILSPDDLTFEPVNVDKPPVPMLSYGLDRVLFNPGVYHLQDPRSRVYNFDPYLEKIMPVSEFDFEALSEYKTSSKDEELLAITRRSGTKFTGSTSSMSGILQHFHYALSGFRKLNHEMLSRTYPDPSNKFSKITTGPSAVFLRYKDGIYALDADKSYDTPNIMSWLGHSLEKLLTTDRGEFERFRRSSPEKAPSEDNSARCYHYSRQGNFLMRSQLDAHDPRLPGSGVFDLKTRAVVSIRMNHKEYEEGLGYQLRFAQGQWESFEREFYDMTRATLLKYSLQVRMGRMDGIFLAYHNIERIFGFQYLSIADMDRVLHGQEDTCLGDQEFKLSISLLDELMEKATKEFPETSIRLHFESRDTKTPFMYVFAEPVTEEQADEIQSTGEAVQKEFARNVVGVGKDNPEVQAAWQNIQDQVDEQVDEDKRGIPADKAQEGEADVEVTEDAETAATEEGTSEADEVKEDEGADEVDEGLVVEEETEVDEGLVVEEEIEVEEATETSDAEETDETTESTPAPEPEEKGPLIGWTLTVRSKVNDGYVDRPQALTPDDNWSIEYHIQEIEPSTRWRLYDALKKRRHQLVGLTDQEAAQSLIHYRNLINEYSVRGRKWRDTQDKIDKEKGVRLFRPLGPGSDAAQEASVSDGSTEQKETVSASKES